MTTTNSNLEKFEALNVSTQIALHNEYCQENGYSDDEIFDFDDEFFNMFFEGKPMEAARATQFGDVNWSDDYIHFNGYGNLESISEHNILDYIDAENLVIWLEENDRLDELE